LENNKIIGPNVKISRTEKHNVTTNFDLIIRHLENGDFEFLEKYAEENMVLSGVSWLVIRIYRTDKKFSIDSHSLIDFNKL